MRYSDKIGRCLRAARESKGYSQDYVADRLGISQSSYACLESGRTGLSVDRFLRLAEILEVDATHVLSRILSEAVDENVAPSKTEQGIHETILVEALQSEIRFLRALVIRQRTADE